MAESTQQTFAVGDRVVVTCGTTLFRATVIEDRGNSVVFDWRGRRFWSFRDRVSKNPRLVAGAQ